MCGQKVTNEAEGANSDKRIVLLLSVGKENLLEKLRLISEIQVGDSKPSEVYEQIKILAGDSLTETAILDLWADRYPEYRPHLKKFRRKDLMKNADEKNCAVSKNFLELRSEIAGVQMQLATRESWHVIYLFFCLFLLLFFHF